MMGRLIALIGCVAGFLAACIPVIDRFNPEIQIITPVQTSYAIQDTIKVVLSFGDNDQLDSAIVSIRRVDEASSSGRVWAPTFGRKLRGRRFDDTLRIVIPTDVQLGNYQMTIRLLDLSRNQTVQQIGFNIRGDERPPIIRQLSLIGLPRDAAGNFLVCRQSVLLLTGSASDNILIREVRAELAGIISFTRPVGSQTVQFDNLFGRDLRIPANAADNSRFLLIVTVIDQNNNTARQTFNLLLNCDEEPPQIRIQSTAPQISANREVTLIEGDFFRILSGTITDNRRLGRLAITFNSIATPRDTVFRANLTGTTVQLGTLLANQRFQPPLTATAGSVYELILFASDSAGNRADPFRIVLNIVKDQPPQIVISEARIRGTLVNLSLTQPNPLPIGADLVIFGKVLEDRALEYFQIFWGPAQRPERLVNLTAQDLTPLPFDLSDPRSVNRFVAPMQPGIAPTMLEYVLEFRVKDNRNPEVVVTYRFILQR
ncbi:MAG: hypothetical protein RMJ87_09475 [Cytophagales bacterium]|nr:hypothetical protein [Bernardetiaceae bacterium]MDW8205246.1 hypothetical protein [Cytophagales bacterium]